MARNLTTEWLTEAAAKSNRPIIIYEGVFASASLRLWNGYGDLSWDSQTWLGNGWLGGIEGGEETTEVEAVDMTVILSGVPSNVISLILGDQKQGARGTIFLGFLDSSGAVTATYRWWEGKYSHAELDEGGDTATARVYYDSRLVDMDRPREGRWTHDAQQKLFSGDKGFEYVIAASDWNGQWGGEKAKAKDQGKRKNKNQRGSVKRK